MTARTPDPDMQKVLDDIAACCKRHGIGVHTFGGIATGDTTLYKDMRRGRRIRPRIREKIYAAIGALDALPPRSKQRARSMSTAKPTSWYDAAASFSEENRNRSEIRRASRRLSEVLSAAQIPPPPTPKRKRTFEELLAAVEAGEVRVTERPVFRAPEPAFTMGGVVGDYSI